VKTSSIAERADAQITRNHPELVTKIPKVTGYIS